MSRSKDKGTDWERAVVTYLQSRGWPHAERRALNGALDRGDVAGIVGAVVECKNAARTELGPWLDEANLEARHARANHGVVWFKRRGKTSAGAGYVLMDGDTYVGLLIEAGYQ